MKLFMTPLFLLFWSATIFAQGLPVFTLYHNGCNSVKVIKEDNGIIPRMWLFGASAVDCAPGPSVLMHNLAGVEVGSFRYTLQRQNGSNWVEVQSSPGTFAGQWTFNNLSVPGIFRVIATIRTHDGIEVFSVTNPCGAPIGFHHDGGGNSFFTNELEVGTPDPDIDLIDASGTAGNNVFCSAHVDAAGGIFMDGSDSFGETSWSVDICMIAGSGCAAWNTTGWQTGQIGTINLLTEVWQNNGATSWAFWTGNTYRIQLALSQTCSGWEATTATFQVVPGSSGCRIKLLEEGEITVFPNPTAEQLSFTGLDTFENPIEYHIMDITGRNMKHDYMPSSSYPIEVSDLREGMYVITLLAEGQRISRKFSVIKR